MCKIVASMEVADLSIITLILYRSYVNIFYSPPLTAYVQTPRCVAARSVLPLFRDI